MTEPAFTLNGRIWIETAGEKVLGPGRVELLERIQQSGSIRQAALQMKMSYKQAWDLVNHMNSHFRLPVVTSQRGGKGGGNAMLTAEGLRVIAEYHRLQEKFKAFLKENSAEMGF
jgi:molybdate transport system regulatory protein